MQHSSEYAQTSVNQAQLASSALSGISLQVKRINEMNLQIASAVEEQSVVSEDINRNIAGIRSACEVTVDAGQHSHRNSGKWPIWPQACARWRRSSGKPGVKRLKAEPLHQRHAVFCVQAAGLEVVRHDLEVDAGFAPLLEHAEHMRQ